MKLKEQETPEVPEAKEIFELYDYMENRLQELGITFEEFTICYKTFQATMTAAGVDTSGVAPEEPKGFAPEPKVVAPEKKLILP